MRFVTSRPARLLLAFCLFLGLGVAAGAQTNEPVAELTLPQARILAVQALETGRPELTLRLTSGLIRANPKDGIAHYLRAAALTRTNQPTEGRKSAARAYRFSEPGLARMRAAQLAASAAYAENRPTLAQIWLRRTAIHTETEEEERLLARDYAILRRQNPWYLSVRTDVRPSDNVNNGSETYLNIVNGIPLGGTVQPALSGVIGAVDISTSYRLRADQRSATYLGGRLYIKQVHLSDSARALAPGARNSDFSSTYFDVSVLHAFAVGQAPNPGSASVRFSLGENWYGGDRSYRLARLEGERTWRPTRQDSVKLSGSYERRFDALKSGYKGDVIGLGLSYSRKLASADTLTLSLSLQDTDTPENFNGTYQAASLRAHYALAKRLGPARVSGGVTLGMSDYPLQSTGYLSPAMPRQDHSVGADVTFFFEDFDYAGFAPTLRLRAARNSSNFSRYSSREFSLSLGVQSKF